MSNEILNSLLKDYEQRKIAVELDAQKRKDELYLKIPKLQEIDDEMNFLAFKNTRNILAGNSSFPDFQEKMNALKFKKLDVLKEYNISPDYLNPCYSCDFCKDTGYVVKDNYQTEMCSCLKQKLLNISFNKSNFSNLDRENFATFNPNMFSDEVDVAKYKFNVSPRSNILNIKNKCLEFVENFDNFDCKNLLFTGNTGLR